MNDTAAANCPCAGTCHHGEYPCSLGCWAAQKPWRVEEARAAALADARPDTALREALSKALEPYWVGEMFGALVRRTRTDSERLEAVTAALAAASPDSAPAGLDALASVPEHAGAWGEPDESYEKGWNDCREAFAGATRLAESATPREAGK